MEINEDSDVFVTNSEQIIIEIQDSPHTEDIYDIADNGADSNVPKNVSHSPVMVQMQSDHDVRAMTVELKLVLRINSRVLSIILFFFLLLGERK